MQTPSKAAEALKSVMRLPSQLHIAAIRERKLLPSAPQEALLPQLDSLIHALPSHSSRMISHTRQLHEHIKGLQLAVMREQQLSKQYPYAPLRIAKRLMHRVPTSAKPEELPPSYYSLSEPPRAPTPPKGFFLHGDVGCGKSMLMNMLFSCGTPHVPASARVHYHAFMTSVYQLLHSYDMMSSEERVKRALFHPLDAVVGRLGASASGGLLCFDEFQIADVADARLMQGVMQRLMNGGTIVCFTANRKPEQVNRSQLRTEDFKPFVDLIYEKCNVVELEGMDYREVLANGETVGVYFEAGDLKGMQQAWKREAGVEWDDVIPDEWGAAYGRSVRLGRVAPDGKSVQITVKDLLEAAMGAEDYRAIARRARAIFVTDVLPNFTGDTRNLARRFITLIDVCYELGTRLVFRLDGGVDSLFVDVDVSNVAQARQLEMAEGMQFETEAFQGGVGAGNRGVGSGTLYTAEDEVFAFRRAVSRLREMATVRFGGGRFDLELGD